MVCYRPLSGWFSRKLTKNGKRQVVFDLSLGFADMPVTIPCQQCIGCRLERSRQWAVRCIHESSLYQHNCFITLTFNDDALLYLSRLDGRNPYSLVKSDFQKFFKRFRKHYSGSDGINPIRYFHCGEYGGRTQRPHHHAIVFNFDFDDKKVWSVRRGVVWYRSQKLEDLWSVKLDDSEVHLYNSRFVYKRKNEYYLRLGFCVLGNVTFESSAYVARYIMKKQTGKNSNEFYGDRVPDYITMSRRPGIARQWIENYVSDVYPKDYVVIRDDIKCKPPKYYDNYYELTNYNSYASVKSKRKKFVLTSDALLEKFRKDVKERVKFLQTRSLVRSYELLC